MGTTSYLEHYNAVRQDVLGKRHERKMKRSIEVVTDPERAAKKKIRRHEKVRPIFSSLTDLQSKGNRKRKAEEFRNGRLVYGR
jgi:U3 small nucleolar RNA-associated protein 20